VNLPILFPDDAVDGILAGRLAGKVLEALVEDDDLVGAANGDFEDLAPVLFAGQGIGPVRPHAKRRQTRHDLGVGEHVVVGIERAELAGLLGEPLPHAGPELLVPGLPGGEPVEDVAEARVGKELGRLEIELGAFVLYLLGDLKDLEDVELGVHNAPS